MYAHTKVTVKDRTKNVPILHDGKCTIVLEVGDWIYRQNCWWIVQDLLPAYAIEIGGDDFWGGVGCAREFHDPPAGTKYLDRTGGATVKTWRER